MKLTLLLAVVAMAGAAAATAAERSGCQLMTVEEWKLRENEYRPVIEGAINGQAIGILIDTGAAHSLIRRGAVEKLRLKTFQAPGQRYFGVGGETRAEGTDIDELRIGTAVRRNWRAIVVGEHNLTGGTALLLGDDFFSQADVEFDLKGRVVRLFKPKSCDRAWLGYWGKEVMAVPLESLERIQFYVQINGKPVLAMLDSGAGLTTLSQETAHELGVTPRTAGAVAAGCVLGGGKERYNSWIAPFASFAIGEEVIRNPQLRFAPLWQHNRKEETGSLLPRRLSGLPDMLLGADFLHSHRVLVAHSQRRMYFSYTGGTVFPTTPGKPCSEYQTK
jgi:predicted aspartyl protease